MSPKCGFFVVKPVHHCIMETGAQMNGRPPVTGMVAPIT
jgi:hypothetical protein